jgi:hypothetical protein
LLIVHNSNVRTQAFEFSIMKIAAFLSLVAVLGMARVAAAQEVAVLEMPDLGLALTHPKAWQVNKVQKSNDLKVLIPIEGSSQRAVLELYGVGFNSEKEVWQLGQKAINEKMKRETMRQWEEEILNVPILLSKFNFVEKDGPQILLTGLVFSHTDKKLMFRLIASPDDFDKAEFVWREVMNSFRTSRPWTPEDPSKKPDPNAPKRTSLPPPIIVKPNSLDAEAKVTKPPVVVAAQVAGRKVEVRIPSEWAGKVLEDGTIQLSHPEVAGSVQLALASTLDSDPSQKALLVASSKTLGTFQKVAKRDETLPAVNKAGAQLATVWRVGTDPKGDLFTCDASIAKGDFYGIAAFRTTSTSKIGAERKLVESLLQNCTIEVVP